MKTLLLCGVAGLMLAGCAPTVPDSGAGVGFGDYGDYQARREAELLGQAPSRVSTESSGVGVNADAIAAANAAIENSGNAPINASPLNPAPEVVTNAAGMSEENNFDAVSNERSIGDDAALIARNSAQYQVIQPTALPSRSGNSGPNIVEYALKTSNPRGTSVYSRSSFGSEAKTQRNCAVYASADLAQEAFLENGGPSKDRKALDPDGDGYACGWDPAPFRAVRGF
ncbi:hypothetical protein [Puniceibacterium sp. IMCC21224]|uniref:hypothetical protein n=1 Tax=Puniceibacterium sp. IMCC21224 TaxID=1618204 RepID=UPI00064DAC76|nr:hypothetical protein [Puniceibacterium sp. IMCC21224]KMK67696.1 hypothetical protein IMCC21224_112568 [Puniceibacterium sp. IMCC21224]